MALLLSRKFREVILRQLLQRDGPRQDNFPLLYRHVHPCPLKALLLADLGGKTRT